MAHLISCEDGGHFDLDTKQGAYKYVSKFLLENGADSMVFSALGKLYPEEEEECLGEK